MRAKTEDENRKWRLIALSPIFTAIEVQGKRKDVLAKKLGISKQRLNFYLRGSVRMPHGFIDQMITELRLDPDAIPPQSRALIERQSQTKGA